MDLFDNENTLDVLNKLKGELDVSKKVLERYQKLLVLSARVVATIAMEGEITTNSSRYGELFTYLEEIDPQCEVTNEIEHKY